MCRAKIREHLRIVQIKDTDGRYVKIDRLTGKTITKKTDFGPYQGVRIVYKKRK